METPKIFESEYRFCLILWREEPINSTKLAKAWMQTDFGESGAAHFAVRASMADTACVTQVEGVNFAYAIDETGAVLHTLVQPGLVFGQDTGLAFPETFAAAPLSELTALTWP